MKALAVSALLTFSLGALTTVGTLGCSSSSPMAEVEEAINELCACKGDRECMTKAGQKFSAATKKIKAQKLSAEDAQKFGKIMAKAVACQRPAVSDALKDAREKTEGARDAVKKTAEEAKKYYDTE